MFLRHPLLSLVTLAYLGLVGWVTLTPQPIGNGADTFVGELLLVVRGYSELNWVTYSGLEFTLNILMFVPIGLFFLLLYGRRRWWLAILTGVILTIAIETAQLFIPSRVSDIRDIISNSIGATAGVIIALILTAGKARRGRAARSPARARIGA